jgi:hypothetical protein
LNAEQWVEQCGLVTLSPLGDLPSIVRLVAGDDATARWWSHPKGTAIFNLYQHLADRPTILVAKLVAGRVTLVHRRLWEPVLVLAQNRERVDAALSRLSPHTLEAYHAVCRQGSVSLRDAAALLESDRRRLKRSVIALEKHALVLTRDEHTDTGAHDVSIQSWRHFKAARAVVAPGNYPLDEARHLLRSLVRGHASPLLS